MRICKRCGINRLIEDFPFHKNNRESDPTYYSRRNKRKLKENKEFVWKYKEEHPCKDCCKFYPHYVMEFDHLYDKFREIAKMMRSYGLVRVFEEISKCDLVCSNCHAIRTFQRAHSLTVEH